MSFTRPYEQNDIPPMLAVEYNLIDLPGTKYETNYTEENTTTVLLANRNGHTNILVKYDPAEF